MNNNLLKYLFKYGYYSLILLNYAFVLSTFTFHPNVSAKELYEIKFYKTRLDHFTFKNESSKFNLKYLISKKYWKKGNAILFYCGNEEVIEYFAKTAAFVWELEQKLSAMVVFGEHRYYGSSLPFGSLSLNSPEYFGYLSIEQVLADFSSLLTYLKSNITGAIDSPVIAIGGSYGGMLAAWFRQKYPNIIAGSIASSAPIFLVENYKFCNKVYQVMKDVYKTKGSEACVNNIHRSWTVIRSMNNNLGLKRLTKIFHLCQPLKNVESLINHIDYILFDISVNNLPYSANISVPLPAWPVAKFCSSLSQNIVNEQKLLESIYSAIKVYGNYSNQSTCIFISTDSTSANSAWGIQTCTEIPIPMCKNGVTDMFYEENITEEGFNSFCQEKYKVKPRSGWFKTLYGGKRFESASNIIFSNGMLDPWSAGGIFKSPNKNIQILKIANGSHHTDLRRSHPLDTVDIKKAREIEIIAIQKWIAQWRT